MACEITYEMLFCKIPYEISFEISCEICYEISCETACEIGWGDHL